MRKQRLRPLLLLASICLIGAISSVKGQDSSMVFNRILSIPDKVFERIDKEANRFEQKLNRQTDKCLNKLQRQEERLKRKLWRTDSVKANEAFGNIDERYSHLRKQLNSQTSTGFSTIYSGHADSLATTLAFLNEHPSLTQTKNIGSNLKSITALQNKFNQTENIRKQIKDRRDKLTQQLQNTSVAKDFAKYKKQVYYYQAQIKEYRDALNDPKLLGSKLIAEAQKIPLFSQFFRRHSELARLFPMPTGNTVASTGIPIPGLQSQAQVIQNIQTQLGTGGSNPMQAVQQQIGAAKDEMAKLRNKFGQLGGSSSNEDELPDFKPNTQKTKSFLKRLQFGSNVQTTNSRTYFPVTTDLGLSIGYKINSKSLIGFGSSYKLGLGNNINSIRLTHQGIGFRSFLDLKLKGSFWISGGYEYNYLSTFRNIQELNNRTIGKQSALLGVSKVVDMRSKIFKKTKVQLLYDFLWNQKLPQTQAVLFRVGYNF